MTHEEARRRLERTTEFRFQGDRVLVRDPRWLRSIEALRAEDRSGDAWSASTVANAAMEHAA